ncbi:hypothetical protein [Rhodohalobacter sulfatireducens]|uniref:Lipoprotein n=1 Tax=Rhodohalobacter sulfatireducens TaxID=2911366 RepID=A0ABS9K7X9_9BACT|nr:hypothetical protein [Rhodohalobacter sulfatireducens]MCG2586956.1 hypothetical protein [Rhodohalobacter sulfatireducens]
MKMTLLKLIAFILFGTLMSGCMVSGGILIEPEPVVIGDPPRKDEPRREHHRIGRKHHIKIPPGHMPPPGKCRVWLDDRPPGQQPPPVSCHSIRHRIPYGAVVVRG